MVIGVMSLSLSAVTQLVIAGFIGSSGCRCARGERLRTGMPHSHWKTTTFVACLRTTGIVAPLVLDGSINGEAFEAYVE